MDYTKELADAVERSNQLIETKLHKFSERLDAFETREAKAFRPHIGGDLRPDVAAAARANPEHVKAFTQWMRDGNVPAFTAALAAIDGNKAGVLSTSSGPDGGFAVPKVIDAMVENLLLPFSPIRSIAQVQQVSTPDYHKLINKRGTAATWVGESSARPSTDASKLADIQPPLGELYAMPIASQWMLDDVYFNAEQWISDELAYEFGIAEGTAFTIGTGVNQPRGFLTYPLAAAGDDAGRAFGTLEYVPTGVSGDFPALTSTVNPVDILFKLTGKLRPGYRAGAVWVMNTKTLHTVASIKDYQGRYVFSPTITPGTPPTILGYSVIEAQDMPDIAANSLSIAFGNFARGYLIVDRIGNRIIRDPFSAKPNVAFYATRRVGGSCLNTECIKLLRFSVS